MQQAGTISRVIDLAAARRAKRPGFKPASRGRVLSAAGFVMLVVSAGFAVNLAYQATRLDALGDAVVLAAFAVTGAYLVASVSMIWLASRLNRTLRASDAGDADAKGPRQDAEATADGAPAVIEFRKPEVSGSGPISLRCRACGSHYRAYASDVSCPDCGRSVRAG